MPPRFRTAITLPGLSANVADTLALARQAESAGYDDLWLADAGGMDALTLAALLGQNTSRVRIGIAVVPAYTRTPAVLASTAATIAQVAPGRFVLGLGTSSHAIIEGWHGLSLGKPLVRMRETVQLLRQMLAGEKTRFAGETLKSHGYRQEAVTGGLPIYLAALRPRMIELAAEFGDGVILNLFPRQALPRIVEHVARGALRAGKDPAEVEIVCRHQVAVTADPEAARKIFRMVFASYYATPVYNQFLAWAGYEHAAHEIREGWTTGDRARTAAAISDELIDEIAIIGTREQCQQRVLDYARGGIHTHVVSCLGFEPDVVDATYRAFAPEHFSFGGLN
jgi:probable F420-dependent oxidoreductase